MFYFLVLSLESRMYFILNNVFSISFLTHSSSAQELHWLMATILDSAVLDLSFNSHSSNQIHQHVLLSLIFIETIHLSVPPWPLHLSPSMATFLLHLKVPLTPPVCSPPSSQSNDFGIFLLSDNVPGSILCVRDNSSIMVKRSLSRYKSCSSWVTLGMLLNQCEAQFSHL